MGKNGRKMVKNEEKLWQQLGQNDRKMSKNGKKSQLGIQILTKNSVYSDQTRLKELTVFLIKI